MASGPANPLPLLCVSKQPIKFCRFGGGGGGGGAGISQSNETMTDGLSLRDLEKVRPVRGPVNWRTTKNKTETRNSERAQTAGFYNDKK